MFFKISFREVSAYFRAVSAYFRGVSAYFARKLVPNFSKQASKSLGPLWQPGVYNDTKERHVNINFLLWLTSRCPWDKRLVVPGLTGPKSLCVRLETQDIYKLFSETPIYS